MNEQERIASAEPTEVEGHVVCGPQTEKLLQSSAVLKRGSGALPRMEPGKD